ncbi:MAG: ATP-binding cassette domain-containing protein [Bacteroidales bacterium]|jgi:ABC-type multidrug transport system fused ATPase/permease subunit|nr:ATP-binding cassette domain-containing protein [Bacteroidales bacterium]MDN5349092.1 hypothetical protein [Bacteroidales bacterium]
MQEENKEPKRKLSLTGLKRLLSLLKFMWPKRWAFFGGLGALVISSLGTLAFPMLLGDLLDAANPEASLSRINQIALILLIIFAVNAVFSYFRIYLFAIVTQFMLARLRQTTYNQLIRLPMAFFSARRVGELNSRITADIAILQETFTFTIAQFIRQLITIIGGISLLTLISFKLTLFMLAFVPLVAIGARVFGKKVRNLSKDAQSQVAASNVIVEETLQGISNVKAFSNELYESSRYFNATNEVIRIALKGAKWRALFISLIVFSLFTSIVGVIWFGVYLVNQGAGISSGDLFKFILYTLFIGASISGMADLYSQVQKAIGATDSLLDILEEETEPETMAECKDKVQLKGNLSFKHVSFAYPSRPGVQVLDGIDFDVKTGQKIALVGASGAGKTTITALLFRFYEPDSGTIYLDDIPAKKISLNCLRKQMAIVPQEVLLFGGTIYENIAYGNTEATALQVEEAALKANALEFINSFPDGFQTIVGERGVQLSGGQKQRIAIARAILRDPKILVLDEATSALDTASESQVQQALNTLMIGRTSIIIAHRLSTIREADRILVIDKGKIVESGSHEELLARDNGKYLALQQMAV